MTAFDVQRIMRETIGKPGTITQASAIANNANLGLWAVVRTWVLGVVGREDEPRVTKAVQWLARCEAEAEAWKSGDRES